MLTAGATRSVRSIHAGRTRRRAVRKERRRRKLERISFPGDRLSAPTGYGFVTHAYNLAHGLVPPETAYLCTIGDYIAMKLCGDAAPVMDASNAASLGFFSLKTRMFDYAALRQVGIDPMVAPPIALTPLIGRFRNTVGVSVAIGDNQASFLASVKDRNAEMLVNVGTGSQFSVFSERCMQAEGLETRPMPGGGWLLVGASLCGRTRVCAAG